MLNTYRILLVIKDSRVWSGLQVVRRFECLLHDIFIFKITEEKTKKQTYPILSHDFCFQKRGVGFWLETGGRLSWTHIAPLLRKGGHYHAPKQTYHRGTKVINLSRGLTEYNRKEGKGSNQDGKPKAGTARWGDKQISAEKLSRLRVVERTQVETYDSFRRGKGGRQVHPG